MITQRNVAKDIAAMAYGKAVYALAPVVAAVGPEQREAVFRYLANEYVGFDESIQRLVEAAKGRRGSSEEVERG